MIGTLYINYYAIQRVKIELFEYVNKYPVML